jgi:hypothetical protein
MAQDNLKTATFRRAALADRSLLVNHLFNNPAAIAPGFSFLPPRELPGEEFLLGCDGEKQLAVVEIALRFDEGLLYRSLAHLKWALNNVLTRGAGAGQLPADRQRRPGIVYIVPDAPPAFTGALEFLRGAVSLTVIQYWYLESERADGFCFEPLALPETSSRNNSEDPQEGRIVSLREQAGLTREEIMKFLA